MANPSSTGPRDWFFAALYAVKAAIPLYYLLEAHGGFYLHPFLEAPPLFISVLAIAAPDLWVLGCLFLAGGAIVRKARVFARWAETAGAAAMALYGVTIIAQYTDHRGHGGEVILLGYGGLLLAGLIFGLAQLNSVPFRVETQEGDIDPR